MPLLKLVQTSTASNNFSNSFFKMSEQSLVDSCAHQTSFVISLLKTLYQDGKNLVVSPYSLVSALAMLLPGTDGQSKLELLQTLFNPEVKDLSSADEQIQLFTTLNSENLQRNNDTLYVANLLYSHLK